MVDHVYLKRSETTTQPSQRLTHRSRTRTLIPHGWQTVIMFGYPTMLRTLGGRFSNSQPSHVRQPSPTTPTISDHRPGTRIDWPDVAKGACILLVVLGHVIGGLQSANLIADGGRGLYGTVREWVYLFHMPVFFMISGLFFSASIRKGIPSLLFTRLAGLIYPYVIWTLVIAVCHWLMASHTNSPPDLSRVLRLWYEPYGYGLWFLYALAIIVVLYAVTRAACGSDFTFLVVTCLFYALSACHLFDSWPIAQKASCCAVYSAFGVVFGERMNRAATSCKSWVLGCVCLTGFALLTVLFSLCGSKAGPIAAVGLASIGCVSVWAGAAYLAAAERHAKGTTSSGKVREEAGSRQSGRPAEIACTIGRSCLGCLTMALTPGLKYLGSISLEIYLAHSLLSTLPRPILTGMLHIRSPHVLVASGFLTGVIGSIILVNVMDWVRFPYLFRSPLPLRDAASRASRIHCPSDSVRGLTAQLTHNRSGN